MATTCIRHRTRAIQGTGGVASPLFGRESIGEVAKWAPCVSPVHSPANPQDLKNRSRTVRSVALETAPHASPPQCSRLPVWPSPRRPWPPPRSVQQGGELGKRGFAAESAVAQICREGGARVSTNVMLRDLDISFPHSSDGRRLEVVAEGLCLFRVPACFGCHSCLHSPRRWNTQEEGGRGGWSCAERGKKKQRGHIPRVVSG